IRNRLVRIVAGISTLSLVGTVTVILWLYNEVIYLGHKPPSSFTIGVALLAMFLLHWGVSGFLGLMREVRSN
ncbi:MAG: hypothetical protein J7L55_02695, partial [Desulfurococcales archaeon]|nr:hypothetical protein [Desulfurococcales archaeon]